MDPLLLAVVLLLLYVLWLIVQDYAKPTVHISDSKAWRHSWKPKNNLTYFCNICELLLTAQGFTCEYCGVSCDKPSCMKIADKKLKCKQQRERKELSADDVPHLFVKGNLIKSNCKKCNLEIESAHEPGIHGVRCCWCHESFHDQCATSDLVCDFGMYQEFVIPPFAVKACRTRHAPKLHLQEITPIPQWKNWSPLVVIVNIKSGSSEADEVATLFRRILNPIQIISLSFRGPAEALEIVKLSPVKCRILVAGGDGSIAWVLNTIHEMKLDDKCAVAICPIGTGNDLSR